MLTPRHLRSESGTELLGCLKSRKATFAVSKVPSARLRVRNFMLVSEDDDGHPYVGIKRRQECRQLEEHKPSISVMFSCPTGSSMRSNMLLLTRRS